VPRLTIIMLLPPDLKYTEAEHLCLGQRSEALAMAY
jgi:hypothetical protein